MASAISSSTPVAHVPPHAIPAKATAVAKDSDGDNDGSKAVAAAPKAASGSVGSKVNTKA